MAENKGYNPNDILKKFMKTARKTGYNVNERKEFIFVEKLLKKLNLSSKYFYEKLASLQLVDEKSTDGIATSKYNSTLNTITYSNERDIIHELFHMSSSSSDKKNTGITKFNNGNKVNVGLDEGITDMFAELSDPSFIGSYRFEKLCSEVLAYLFGYNIFNGYFNNSYQEFMKSFDSDDALMKNIESYIKTIDIYHMMMEKVYSGAGTSTYYSELSKHTERIISRMFTICEIIDKDRQVFADYLKDKIKTGKFEDIDSIIGLDKIDIDSYITKKSSR